MINVYYDNIFVNYPLACQSALLPTPNPGPRWKVRAPELILVTPKPITGPKAMMF